MSGLGFPIGTDPSLNPLNSVSMPVRGGVSEKKILLPPSFHLRISGDAAKDSGSRKAHNRRIVTDILARLFMG